MNHFPIRLILADLRSTANVGSILRTADATGVELIYASGYTPYPHQSDQPDIRPPYIAHSNTKAIAKTALGAEAYLPVQHTNDAHSAIHNARDAGFKIIMLEQSKKSLSLASFVPDSPIALVLGSEVPGIHQSVLTAGDIILEIPMLGRKESYGVAVAAGIALHYLRFGKANI